MIVNEYSPGYPICPEQILCLGHDLDRLIPDLGPVLNPECWLLVQLVDQQRLAPRWWRRDLQWRRAIQRRLKVCFSLGAGV